MVGKSVVTNATCIVGYFMCCWVLVLLLYDWLVFGFYVVYHPFVLVFRVCCLWGNLRLCLAIICVHIRIEVPRFSKTNISSDRYTPFTY